MKRIFHLRHGFFGVKLYIIITTNRKKRSQNHLAID